MNAKQMLKMAGFPDTKKGRADFYKLYPTSESFMMKFGGEAKPFPTQPTEKEFFSAGFVPDYPMAFYAKGGEKDPLTDLTHQLYLASKQNPQKYTYPYETLGKLLTYPKGKETIEKKLKEKGAEYVYNTMLNNANPSNDLSDHLGTLYSALSNPFKKGGEMPCFECGGQHMAYGGESSPFNYGQFPAMKDGGNWIQAANKKMKAKGTKGAFTDYCGGKVTVECIKRGLNSPDPTIRKRAAFAKAMRSIASKQFGGEIEDVGIEQANTFKKYLKRNTYNKLADEVAEEMFETFARGGELKKYQGGDEVGNEGGDLGDDNLYSEETGPVYSPFTIFDNPYYGPGYGAPGDMSGYGDETALPGVGQSVGLRQGSGSGNAPQDPNAAPRFSGDMFRSIEMRGNPQKALRNLAALDIAGMLFSGDERNAKNAAVKKYFDVNSWAKAVPSGDMGDDLVDNYAGQSFRPNKTGAKVTPWGQQFIPGQIGRNSVAKMGGEYQMGGEYEMTDEEIAEFLRNGGTLELLD